ncbi:MAG: NAD(P)H-hydrate dehydratase [Desulfobacterales bacterium]|nr:NAD(P)H-hydrate dehydratase [Desulfobacterales bacterium]
MYLVTAAEMQQMDGETIRSFGIPGRVLMENAGRGVTRVLFDKFPAVAGQRLAILAGSGNNGGDGFVVARYAAQQDVAVVVYLLAGADRVTGDARANLDLLAPLEIPVVEIPDGASLADRKTAMAHHGIWVDAVFGTGLNADIQGHYQAAIDLVNSFNRPVLAVDIPSGINADTGQICGTCIRATTTVTFAFPKIGHAVLPGKHYTGSLEVIDIGIPRHIADAVAPRQRLTTPADVTRDLVQRAPNAHKGDTGHLLVVAGSTGKTGAAVMTCEAAMRTGAGLVSLGTPASLNAILETMLVEVMTVPLPETDAGGLSEKAGDQIELLLSGKRCLAIGPGLGPNAATGQLVRRLLHRCEIPMVIDADGLNHIAGEKAHLEKMKAPTVLTPHPGEMARLTGLSTTRVQRDRVSCARDFATATGTIVVLKGAGTVIATPSGKIYINPTGNPGMASGGMGDILTGIVAGLITQGYPPETAAVTGVYLHGAAADALASAGTPTGYLASDLLGRIPEQLGTFLG